MAGSVGSEVEIIAQGYWSPFSYSGNSDGQIDVHIDRNTNTESVFVARYPMNHLEDSIELYKSTIVNNIQDCPATAENSFCNGKIVDFRAQVVTVSAINANQFYVLVYKPTIEIVRG